MSDVKFRATTPHTAGRVSHTKSGRSELAWRQSHHSRRAQFFVTCRRASRKPCTNTDCLVALLARRSRSTDGQPCCAVHPCITPSADNRLLTIDILRWQVVATDDLGLHSMCGLCARCTTNGRSKSVFFGQMSGAPRRSRSLPASERSREIFSPVLIFDCQTLTHT